MVSINKLLILGGDTVGLYLPTITPNDIIITNSRKVLRSLTSRKRVILLEDTYDDKKSRSERFIYMKENLGQLEDSNIDSLQIVVFQEDIPPGNTLIPFMHKVLPTNVPFLVEHKGLTVDTFALLKELTLIGMERSVFIINRQVTPSSSKLRRVLIEAIIRNQDNYRNGVRSIAVKRFKTWVKLKQWIKDAQTLIKNIDLNQTPKNYQPYIQSLKSRIREASLYLNGTKYTMPAQENLLKTDYKLEPLTKFKTKKSDETYCFTGSVQVDESQSCIRLSYLDDEVIYVALPKLEPIFPYEEASEEVVHVMRLYEKTVSKMGYGSLHPFNPSELAPAANINSWEDIVLFLSDHKEVELFIRKMEESLKPLFTLRSVVLQCEDPLICDEKYNASINELRKMLNEPFSSYVKLVDEYLKAQGLDEPPSSDVEKKIENNLATLIMSITDDEFLEFITRNYNDILKLLVKLSQVNR